MQRSTQRVNITAPVTPLWAFWVYNPSKVLKLSYHLYCSVTALARCLHVLRSSQLRCWWKWTPRSLLTFTYSHVLSEIVIAGRFLSKLCTCDIWLVDSNIVLSSSGRDSISSSRQKGKSLLTGKVLLAVQAKNEFNLSGSCRKGCWLGFNMRWIIRHTSFGLLEDLWRCREHDE